MASQQVNSGPSVSDRLRERAVVWGLWALSQRPALVWQGAPPISSCVLGELGEQLSYLETTQLELRGH